VGESISRGEDKGSGTGNQGLRWSGVVWRLRVFAGRTQQAGGVRGKGGHGRGGGKGIGKELWGFGVTALKGGGVQ